MNSVKLLSLLLCVLSVCSIAASQACPASGVACYPSDCCASYRQCSGNTWYAVQPSPPGTVCKGGVSVWPSECTTPCSSAAPTSAPTSAPTPAATSAPTPAATSAPTPAATKAPTPAPTNAPTPAPTTAANPASGMCSASVTGSMGAAWSTGSGYGATYSLTITNNGQCAITSLSITMGFPSGVSMSGSPWGIVASGSNTYTLPSWASSLAAAGSLTAGFGVNLPSSNAAAISFTTSAACSCSSTPATSAPTPAPTVAPTSAPTPAQTSAPAPASTPAPAPASTPAPATASPPLSGSTTRPVTGNGFGQILMAYYSGVGPDTIGSGGINALAMAFFDPTPLGSNTCDFTDPNTNCIVPAAGSGGSKNLAWALNVFQMATPLLSANTAPVRNGKPVIYFSFGGESQGGACWDTLFGNQAMARTFGLNAAKLVTTVYQTIGQSAYVGFDLDVEGMTTALPYIETFVRAFRSVAPYNTFPLQICSLSGLSDPLNADYFKIGIMQQMGPTGTDIQGINFLNMMVANVDESCAGMSAYWLHPSLSFIPAANKIFGMWGELIPSWMLHEPGCTSASGGYSALFPFMQQSGAGIGIWQWWSGDASGIASILSQVRQS